MNLKIVSASWKYCHMNDLIVGKDGRARPGWARDGILREYYDAEWGDPVSEERGIYERICLEAFQAGLSWKTVLEKRPALRQVFQNFNPDVVCDFDEADVARLMGDQRIIRNRRKIEAAITNAKATVKLRESQPLTELVWSYRPKRTNAPKTNADIPSKTPESAALSKRLKKEGFKFVGPTTAYALMQAIGMVDDNLVGAWKRGRSGVFDERGYARDLDELIAEQN